MKNMYIVMLVSVLMFLISPAMDNVHAQSRKISKDTYFGCTDRDYYGKLSDYAMQSDLEAFKKGLMAGVLIGKCTFFKLGEEVFLVDVSVFSGLVKIRRKGELVEYWTSHGAARRGKATLLFQYERWAYVLE